MIQIPITGLYAILDAAHAGVVEGLLFGAQQLIDYQPYLSVFFN